MEFMCTVVLLAAIFQSSCQQGWVKLGPPHSNHTLRVTFAIKQANPEWLVERLKAVSYPDSAEYGNYMNFDEISKYVFGNPESVQAVLETLQAVGIPSSKVDFTLGRDFAVVGKMPLKVAEKLFFAAFYQYRNPDCGENTVISSESLKLPPHLVDHVDFVSGIKEFPLCRKRYDMSLSSTSKIRVTPTRIAEDYNTSYYVSTNKTNSQAVASFVDQYFSPADLSEFQTKFMLPDNPMAKVVGNNDPDSPGIEASLDVDYISATGRAVSTWFISINKGMFLEWILSQINTTDSPWVHSVSYGGNEGNQKNYLDRINSEFMKFGVSGRTVLFASGDSGVTCKSIDGKIVYSPSWPASSPYITAVGGTESRSSAWTHSGGGFSNVFPMPEYQKEAVSAYVSKLPDTSMFNAMGRAYPDVSAYAVNCVYIISKKEDAQSGTSCAAPIFAGIVASLNDRRLNDGNKTLGFLNPLLYQLNGDGFNDIMSGQNSDKECEGFKASQGWDPASGWGTPNVGLLMNKV